MSKILTRKSALVVVVAFLLSAGTASAGERTGNGGSTPIQNLIALIFGIPLDGPTVNSLCAYSGLEDANDPVVPGDTQTPHEEGGIYPDPGAARVCSVLNYGKLRELQNP